MCGLRGCNLHTSEHKSIELLHDILSVVTAYGPLQVRTAIRLRSRSRWLISPAILPSDAFISLWTKAR